MFARIGEDGSVWGPLLEKAMAYYHGTYEALDGYGGWPEVALNTLAGAPGKTYFHDAFYSLKKKDLWELLIELPDCDMIQADTENSQNGIVSWHAYTVLRPI